MKIPEGYIHACEIDELKENGIVVVRGKSTPVAIVKQGKEVYGIDNRCPHMGFPLDKGTIKDGILTCHWHHARFDLGSGCAFDLFADDVPSYEVAVIGKNVYVSKTPATRPSKDYYFARLRRGLEQNISLVTAKSILGLVEEGVDYREIVVAIALFGATNRDDWADGMTTLAVVSNLWPLLSERTSVFALASAARLVAANCSGQPARRKRNPLTSDRTPMEQLNRWFRHWVMVRHRDATERTLLTAAQQAPDCELMNETVFAALPDRVYSATGHTLDFANKAYELLGVTSWEHAQDVLASISRGISAARGEEERSAWRNPIDLIPLLKTAEATVAEVFKADPEDRTAAPPDEIGVTLLGADPEAILNILVDSIKRGVCPLELARQVAYAAAVRLAQFPESNDIRDWFNPVHTFIYCNAVYQTVTRSRSAHSIRAILQGSMSVYIDRFLNIPAANLPGVETAANGQDPERTLEEILNHLDRRERLSRFTDLVAGYLYNGHPAVALIDTLTYAISREDLDFHKIQVLEAAVRQSELWQGREEAIHILVGAARYLAAHCPTPRANAQPVEIAIRLHRGDAIYEEEQSATV
jgi:nitrite reductase/ring-hydroxylating ferredoxin subunit